MEALGEPRPDTGHRTQKGDGIARSSQSIQEWEAPRQDDVTDTPRKVGSNGGERFQTLEATAAQDLIHRNNEATERGGRVAVGLNPERIRVLALQERRHLIELGGNVAVEQDHGLQDHSVTRGGSADRYRVNGVGRTQRVQELEHGALRRIRLRLGPPVSLDQTTLELRRHHSSVPVPVTKQVVSRLRMDATLVHGLRACILSDRGEENRRQQRNAHSGKAKPSRVFLSHGERFVRSS